MLSGSRKILESKQVEGKPYQNSDGTGAHADGVTAENEISGYERGTTTSEAVSISMDGSLSGILRTKYTKQGSNNAVNIEMFIIDSDITRLNKK